MVCRFWALTMLSGMPPNRPGLLDMSMLVSPRRSLQMEPSAGMEPCRFLPLRSLQSRGAGCVRGEGGWGAG
jgi:hypothetical protein